MAATAFWYAQAFRSGFHKEMNLEADTLKLMLTTSGYAYNRQTDRYQSVVTNEIPATGGYTAGGLALSGVTVTDAGGVWTLNANAVTWSNLTAGAAIQVLVLYDSTPGSAATNPLIWLCDLGAGSTPAGIDFVVNFNASGIATVTA